MQKERLYLQAKEAYYSGNPIMGDVEFDELEKELGLENNSPVGSSSPNYTVRHPFIMGSLSKVQIKENNDKVVDWFKFGEEVLSYLRKSKSQDQCVLSIVTPKFDGCSFEYHYKDGKALISGRGDGNYGQDITKHLEKLCEKFCYYIPDNEFTLRGEVLIDKDTFNEKYAKDFANTRAFVAGVLNRKYEDIPDKSILDDLSVVVYDYRVCENNEWIDYDWLALQAYIPEYMLPEHFKIVQFDGASSLKAIYEDFDNYRNSYRFSLDGIVIKPTFEYRINNTTKERPDDCVAVKFKPMIRETVVTKIEWQLGKTGEYTPVVLFEPFMLDGKVISKATGHNMGNITENGINVGAKIQVSLAGDIIPFIYGVITPSKNKIIEMPEDSYIEGCHLMKRMNAVEKMEVDFMASCKSLNIFGLGDQIAKKIFDSLEYKVEHIFFVDEYQIRKALETGEGKTAVNIINAIETKKENISLHELIASMNIPDCGPKCAYQCARKLTTGEADFSGLSNLGWQWCVSGQLPFGDNENGAKIISKLISILNHIKPLNTDNEMDNIHRFDSYYIEEDGNDDKIKVILTGSPTKYKNKKAFLADHPEYKETSKWKECKILFAGDLSKASAKLTKAKELNIEIREY